MYPYHLSDNRPQSLAPRTRHLLGWPAYAALQENQNVLVRLVARRRYGLLVHELLHLVAELLDVPLDGADLLQNEYLLNYVNPSIPKDETFWVMNLKNITL